MSVSFCRFDALQLHLCASGVLPVTAVIHRKPVHVLDVVEIVGSGQHRFTAWDSHQTLPHAKRAGKKGQGEEVLKDMELFSHLMILKFHCTRFSRVFHDETDSRARFPPICSEVVTFDGRLAKNVQEKLGSKICARTDLGVQKHLLFPQYSMTLHPTERTESLLFRIHSERVD